MDSIISTFHIDWKIILAQAINFGIVLAVLYFFAIKPLRKLMDERAKKIEGGIEDAKNNAEVLKATRAEYADVISKAKIEATSIFQEGKRDAEAKKAEMLEKAKSEVNIMIENGKKTLGEEKIKMVSEAKREIVSVVVEATEKLLGSKVDQSFDDKAVKELKNL